MIYQIPGHIIEPKIVTWSRTILVDPGIDLTPVGQATWDGPLITQLVQKFLPARSDAALYIGTVATVEQLLAATNLPQVIRELGQKVCSVKLIGAYDRLKSATTTVELESNIPDAPRVNVVTADFIQSYGGYITGWEHLLHRNDVFQSSVDVYNLDIHLRRDNPPRFTPDELLLVRGAEHVSHPRGIVRFESMSYLRGER